MRTKLGNSAPDRDCLFLRLVIPFAGLEANANDNGLSGLLDSVDFANGASPREIKTMKEIRDSLSQAKQKWTPVIEQLGSEFKVWSLI